MAREDCAATWLPTNPCTGADDDPLDALRREWHAAGGAGDDVLDAAALAALTEPLSTAEQETIVQRLLLEQAHERARTRTAARTRPLRILGVAAGAIAAAGVLGFLATRDLPSAPVPAAAASELREAPPSAEARQMEAELAEARAEATQLDQRAESLVRQAMYEQAEALFRQALSLREHVLGPDHEDVAESLQRLAGLYQTQHMYAKAEPLYFRALEIRPPVVVF